MCDTLWKRLNGEIFFAKNSDRSCNEPNLTVFIAGRKRNEKELKCTYITIPQVERVNSVLLVKPSWMWGAEMGINEHGVTIGNEAVFTKSKGKKEEKLLGMDMLRIALERADSAKNALEVIIDLLTVYGQGGNCGYDKKFYYDNSFLITDKSAGYIIETSGKDYTVKELSDRGNISNRLSIDEDFTNKHIEPVFSFFAGSRQRLDTGCARLAAAKDLSDIFHALRAHNGEADKKLFLRGSVKSVCMHQGVLIGDHTTGSMVVHYGKKGTSIWITGSSTPCLSVFKPIIFGEEIPPVFLDEKKSFAYWSRREYLNRAVFSGYVDATELRKKAYALEDEFVAEYQKAVSENADLDTLKTIYGKCSEKEEALIAEYDDIIEKVKYGELKLKGQWKKRTEKL